MTTLQWYSRLARITAAAKRAASASPAKAARYARLRLRCIRASEDWHRASRWSGHPNPPEDHRALAAQIEEAIAP